MCLILTLTPNNPAIPFQVSHTLDYLCAMAVHFCNNSLELENLLQHISPDEVFTITDDNCNTYCLPELIAAKTLSIHNTFTFPSGEKNKCLATYENAIDFLAKKNLSRKGTIINIGGGVTTDLGGFVAASYKRGVRFIHIPTSLMAMVDASHGGKVGINNKELKNYIGSFSQPDCILIYPGFLKTLPEVELLSGYAEVLKHGIIADKSYWEYTKTLNPFDISATDWLSIIQQSIDIKMAIVEADPLEANERKKLNFGHTVGHAFESLLLKQNASISHGHAVAAGMIVESAIAHRINKLPLHEQNDITHHISKLYDKLPIYHTDIPQLITLMSYDKKNPQKGIEMALPNNIGQCDYNISLETDVIEACLIQYMS